MSDRKQWVKVSARSDTGFWRGGVHWPREVTYRQVSGTVADRVCSEPNLMAEKVADSAVPAGWQPDGGFDGSEGNTKDGKKAGEAGDDDSEGGPTKGGGPPKPPPASILRRPDLDREQAHDEADDELAGRLGLEDYTGQVDKLGHGPVREPSEEVDVTVDGLNDDDDDDDLE